MFVVPRSSVVLLRLSVVACVSSVCAKSDGSHIYFWNFAFQVCRTGRAKLNLSMRKNPHENAFSLLATLVKRVKTDRRPKNFIFSKPFSLLKQPFLHAHVSKTHAETIFAYIHEKSKIAFSKKGPITPPPPPPPLSPTLSVGAAFSRSKPRKKLGSVTVA